MKKLMTAGLAAGLVGFAGVIGAVAAAPTALAECGEFYMWGNGGGNCDGPIAPDGSFQRCTTVYVMGIGGTNCFVVPGPPPAPMAGPPAPAPPQQLA